MKAKTTNSKSARTVPNSAPIVPKNIQAEPSMTIRKGPAVVGKPLKVANEKEQLRQILMMVKAIRSGDFSLMMMNLFLAISPKF